MKKMPSYIPRLLLGCCILISWQAGSIKITSLSAADGLQESAIGPANYPFFPGQQLPGEQPPPASLTGTSPITPGSVSTPLAPPPAVLAPASEPLTPADMQRLTTLPTASTATKEISVNFSNVSMIEYIRFISRVSGKNFLFDEQDLLFNVTIISQEPTSVDNLMAALLQELKIRGFSLIEQGNNIIIHTNAAVRAPATIVAPGIPITGDRPAALITRVFRFNTLDPIRMAEVIKPLLSDDALVEVLADSNNLILTDLAGNVTKIAQLISSLDAPGSGMTIGQYVVRNAFVDSLVDLAEKILQPITQGNPLVLVPHPVTNSIYIVSNPFIVEKAIVILQNLDNNEGRTKIMSLESLKLSTELLSRPGGIDGTGRPGEGRLGVGIPGEEGGPGSIGTQGRGIGPGGFPEGPGGPGLLPGGISSTPRWVEELPAGHIERTMFFIHKLKFRKGDQIEVALRKIGDSLRITGTSNQDLIAAIDSIQWIESSNSLIFTGTVSALEKVKELINEVDSPLRQVYIEVLVLDTSIDDSLDYGVDWGTRFGGGNQAGAAAFLGAENGTVFTSAIDTTDVISTAGSVSGRLLARSVGFHLGVIGRHLCHGGTTFNSIGALVNAIHDNSKANIIMNPKIVTEDNHPAEIFVGSTTRYKTQSISNDLGNVITNNFQFLDVGTTLRVTPLIGTNDVITLDIVQEITNAISNANPAISNANPQNVDVNLVPVINKSKTTTKIHVPNGYFVIISGMIRDDQLRTVSRIPCLGGIPIIGSANKRKNNRDSKRNLMIFIRPLIVDTAEELETITRRQQDVWREKTKFRRSWNYETDEALDFLNLKATDPDEIGCTIK